jgi:hypothetical protein
MGSMLTCQTDDAKLQTPMGSCGCAHSACGCFGKTSANQEEQINSKIQTAVRVEMTLLQAQLIKKMQEMLEKNGKLPQLNVAFDEAQGRIEITE